MDIFGHSDYKLYLEEKIENMPRKGRGVKKALSEYVGFQTAYLSKVLGAGAHFSLEQGLKIAAFFGLSHLESKFFFLLIQKQRAGTVQLKNHFQKEMDEIKAVRLDLKKRLKVKGEIAKSDESRYYSSWHYAAVHLGLLIEGRQTIAEISEALRLPKSVVGEVLEFLVTIGLARANRSGFEIGPGHPLHLSKNSPEIFKHHANWRVHALGTLDTSEPSNLHYTSVASIAKKDIPKFMEIFLKCIEQYRATLTESAPEDTMQVLCMDFYNLK